MSEIACERCKGLVDLPGASTVELPYFCPRCRNLLDDPVRTAELRLLGAAIDLATTARVGANTQMAQRQVQKSALEYGEAVAEECRTVRAKAAARR